VPESVLKDFTAGKYGGEGVRYLMVPCCPDRYHQALAYQGTCA
jgi:hypothetical protein